MHLSERGRWSERVIGRKNVTRLDRKMSEYNEALADAFIKIWDEVAAEITEREAAEESERFLKKVERCYRDGDQDGMVDLFEEYCEGEDDDLESHLEGFTCCIEIVKDRVEDFHEQWHNEFQYYVEDLPEEKSPLREIVWRTHSAKEPASDLLRTLINDSVLEIGLGNGFETFVSRFEIEGLVLIENEVDHLNERKVLGTWEALWDP